MLCHWCRQPFGFDRPITLEHLIPCAYGGSDEDDNLVLACERCNTDRHHLARCTHCGHRVKRGGIVRQRQVWHRNCAARASARLSELNATLTACRSC